MSLHEHPAPDRSETLWLSGGIGVLGDPEMAPCPCMTMGLLTFPDNDNDGGCQPGLRHQVREHMVQGEDNKGCRGL